MALAAYKIETWCLLLLWDFRLSLDFLDSGLYTCTAVARLTLALAKLSCFVNCNIFSTFAICTGCIIIMYFCRQNTHITRRKITALKSQLKMTKCWCKLQSEQCTQHLNRGHWFHSVPSQNSKQAPAHPIQQPHITGWTLRSKAERSGW